MEDRACIEGRHRKFFPLFKTKTVLEEMSERTLRGRLHPGDPAHDGIPVQGLCCPGTDHYRVIPLESGPFKTFQSSFVLCASCAH